MLWRFNDRARQAVALARDEASLLNHDTVGTGHMLLGLLREEHGLAARLLRESGVTVERARAHLVTGADVGEDAAPEQMAFTPHAKRALELALRQALSLRHGHIATEHILLGLVGEERGAAVRILRDLGARPEKIGHDILRLYHWPGARRETDDEERRQKAEGESDRRQRALERATEVRTFRARVKRDLKKGKVHPAQLFREPPRELETAKVADLLLSVPKYGRVKVNRALSHCRIAPSKTVGGLSRRQRDELVQYLRR